MDRRNISERLIYRGEARATQELTDAGIPGIKYLDQGSRLIGAWISSETIIS